MFDRLFDRMFDRIFDRMAPASATQLHGDGVRLLSRRPDPAMGPSAARRQSVRFSIEHSIERPIACPIECPARFKKVGEFSDQLTLRFDAAKLKECEDSEQLRVLGELCESGEAHVHALGTAGCMPIHWAGRRT